MAQLLSLDHDVQGESHASSGCAYAAGSKAINPAPIARVQTRGQTKLQPDNARQAKQQQPMTAEQQQMAHMHHKLHQQAQQMAKLNSQLEQAAAMQSAAESKAEKWRSESSETGALFAIKASVLHTKQLSCLVCCHILNSLQYHSKKCLSDSSCHLLQQLVYLQLRNSLFSRPAVLLQARSCQVSDQRSVF